MLKLTGLLFTFLTVLFCYVPNAALAETQVKTSPRLPAPLDETILGYKRSLVQAQEKIVFEEYIRHKELGTAISVSKIAGLEFETGDHADKVKITLTPAPGAAQVKLAEIFHKDYWDANGKPIQFYKLFSPESSKKSDDNLNCSLSLICMPVAGLKSNDGKQLCAYLKMDNGNQNIKAFADLINRIFSEVAGFSGQEAAAPFKK